ncbi:hypothetical protein F5B20DRAFT_521963 [Whalleya microplaca]|nr:hypothetical protein F5B20DRAFT_521963 [Whalleya microplaca]
MAANLDETLSEIIDGGKGNKRGRADTASSAAVDDDGSGEYQVAKRAKTVPTELVKGSDVGYIRRGGRVTATYNMNDPASTDWAAVGPRVTTGMASNEENLDDAVEGFKERAKAANNGSVGLVAFSLASVNPLAHRRRARMAGERIAAQPNWAQGASLRGNAPALPPVVPAHETPTTTTPASTIPAATPAPAPQPQGKKNNRRGRKNKGKGNAGGGSGSDVAIADIDAIWKKDSKLRTASEEAALLSSLDAEMDDFMAKSDAPPA